MLIAICRNQDQVTRLQGSLIYVIPEGDTSEKNVPETKNGNM